MAFVVLYDACVLYPAPLRDLLVRIANTGIVRARWTDAILDECFRSILEPTLLLKLSSGRECFFFGDLEHGDDEGRASLARCMRSIEGSRLLKAGEVTTRIMLKTHLADLVVSREDDPIRKKEVEQGETTDPIERRAEQKRWLADARRRKEAVVRVSLAVVTLGTGERRAYGADVEFGDGAARGQVARDVRQLRRLGLLEAAERVERYVLEVPLNGNTAKLTADPIPTTPTGARSQPRG